MSACYLFMQQKNRGKNHIDRIEFKYRNLYRTMSQRCHWIYSKVSSETDSWFRLFLIEFVLLNSTSTDSRKKAPIFKLIIILFDLQMKSTDIYERRTNENNMNVSVFILFISRLSGLRKTEIACILIYRDLFKPFRFGWLTGSVRWESIDSIHFQAIHSLNRINLVCANFRCEQFYLINK